MDECLESDDSMLAREPVLKIAVDNVAVVSHDVDGKIFDRRDNFNEELNQHGQQSSHLLHAEFRYETSESFPIRSHPMPPESDHENIVETKSSLNQERSPFDDNNDYQGEMDELHHSNFSNPFSQSKSKTFNNEKGTEDSPNSQESPLTENMNQGSREEGDFDMGRSPRTGRARNMYSENSQDVLPSHIHKVEWEATDLQTGKSVSSPKSNCWDNESYKDNSLGGNRMPPQSDHQYLGRAAGGSISPMSRGQYLRAPEGSPSLLHSLNGQKDISSPQGSPDPCYEPRSHSGRMSSPPEKIDVRISPEHVSPARQTSASRPGIRQESLHKDSFAGKHISASTKSHHSPTNYRRRDRSESQSPIRHRDLPIRQRDSPIRHRGSPIRHRGSPIRHRGSPIRHRGSSIRHRDSPIRHRESPIRHRDSYGYQRGYHDRSRSRSPYSRAHHRSRSPYSRARHRSTRRRHSPMRRSPYPDHRAHHRSPRRRPWSPPRDRKNGLGKPGSNLFVAGFSFATTERDLERKFDRFGRVQDVRVVRDKRSGDSRGFGFLTLESDEDADAAIRALDETEWNGRIILVEKTKS